MNIERTNLDIKINSKDIIGIINESKYTPTIKKSLIRIFSKYFNSIFGRGDIVEYLKCSNGSGTNYINYLIELTCNIYYLKGDFSKAYYYAERYKGTNYGGYDLFKNNCLHYVHNALVYSMSKRKTKMKLYTIVPILYNPTYFLCRFIKLFVKLL